MKNISTIMPMHVPYSIRELILFGAAAVFARLIFIGFFNTSQTNSWATALSVIAIAGAMEGLGMAMVQSRLRPFSGGDFPLKLYLLTVIGSMVAWILVLGPALSMMSFIIIDTKTNLALHGVLATLR